MRRSTTSAGPHQNIPDRTRYTYMTVGPSAHRSQEVNDPVAGANALGDEPAATPGSTGAGATDGTDAARRRSAGRDRSGNLQAVVGIGLLAAELPDALDIEHVGVMTYSSSAFRAVPVVDVVVAATRCPGQPVGHCPQTARAPR